LRPGELRWAQDAYPLVFGGLLLLGARAGDMLGRRRVFVFGLVVFSIASLLPFPFCLRIPRPGRSRKTGTAVPAPDGVPTR
jgi:MFS family permease